MVRPTWRWAIAALSLTTLVGCSADPPETASTTDAAPPPAISADGPRLTAAELQPEIRQTGPAEGGPTQVVIDFARPVVAESAVGQAAAGQAVMRIEPPLDVELRFTSRSTLTFTPARGFAPGSRYEVELVEIDTPLAELTAEPGRWSRVFETPPFRFLRYALASLDFQRHEAEVDLIFNAAVDPDEVESRAQATLVAAGGGTRGKLGLRFAPGSHPQAVRVRVAAADIVNGDRLELRLAAGVPSRLDPTSTAAAMKATISFEMGPEARILAAHRDEGTNGFYLEVVCDDTAVDARRWYWDRLGQSSYELSTRCQLDEDDAALGLHFEPAVAFSLAPSAAGFRIFADFARGDYQLRIDAGVATADGGMVHRAFEKKFTIPARSPRIRFATKGRYVPRAAWRSLAVRHLNLEQAQLSVRHVPPENLIFWMSDDGDERASERTSNLLIERTIPLSGPADRETTSQIDLASLIPADTRGLLELQLANEATRDSSRLLLTDLQLIAKRTGPAAAAGDPQEVHVWALDMDSTAGQRGVDVQLVRKSGFVVADCLTGADGGCRLVVPPEPLDPSPPFAIIARRGQDLTYLKMSELEVEVQETRIAGEPYRGEAKYRAAIYSDRGVYRPGETAHLAAIVRQQDHLAPPEGLPVVAKLIDPRGQTMRRLGLATNAAGYVKLDSDFAAFATTGRYELALEVAEREVGRYGFQVEEFVPERLKVEAKGRDAEMLSGEAMGVDVAARYLFGGVPARHKVELQCELAPSVFQPANNANFHYGVWRPQDVPVRPLDLGRVSGELDDEGRGRFDCPDTGRAGGLHGPAQLVARAAVFESGSGRTTVGRADVPVHPERFYLGLSSGSTKIEAGQDLKVDGVVVDWRGNVAATATAEVEVELVRLESEYGWYFDEVRGYETYRRYLRPVTEQRRTVAVAAGKFQVDLQPARDGVAFLVRATAAAARTDLEIEGSGDGYYWAPQEAEVDQTPRPGRPTWIAIETPASVNLGERFPISFAAPYRGRVLLTAETDRLLRSEWLDVEAGETVWFLEIDELVPNVYVTAFLIKDPHLDSREAFLPDRAFGIESLRIEPAELTHALTLSAPAEVRSSSTLTVELELGPTEGPTWATVAAVDEGILSLTRFASPDPFTDIFKRRALGVETFETVGWTLLVPPAGPSSTVGGDEGARLGRVQPIDPVALWSGLVEVPDDGRLAVTFDVPSYRGELRVMAVTAGPEKMGHAEASVMVRDPLVVQATLPRFLTRDDEVEIPVFLTNLAGAARTVEARLEVEGLPLPGFMDTGDRPAPIEIVGNAQRTLQLAHGESDVVIFRARALQTTGAARLRASASSGDLRVVEKAQLPLLPAGPPSRTVERLELETGTLDLTPHFTGWLPLSERSTIWVTANPYGDAFDHLGYLLRYPYGCLEQTTSSTRPLLYLARLLGAVEPRATTEAPVEDLVAHGIDRLFTMQTPAGGFAYWPGGLEPAFWGTAYAVHFLLDAQKLGYAVPSQRLDEALGWIERQITHTYEAGVDDGYGRDAEPYLHFVLAHAERPRSARIERLIEQIGSATRAQDREHLYMLKAALYLAGDHRYEEDLKAPDLSPIQDLRSNGWSFYSDRRMRGFMLATFTELFGSDAAGEQLASLVAASLRGRPSGWFTTQELVWGITGLGKYVEVGSRDFTPPTLLAEGRQLAPSPAAKGSTGVSWHLARASEYDSLKLAVTDKGDGKLYAILSSEGVRRVPDWRTGGEGLRLTRRFLTPAGEPLDLAQGEIALGDLVYVELTLANTSRERIANIALVDRIPAGWEIENPRLGRDGSAAWIDSEKLWQIDHMDLRDDRLEVFGHLEKNERKQVVYAARAVSAGSFTLPMVTAEAMYDPRIWAREGARRITISGPWQDTTVARSPATPTAATIATAP